MQCAGFAEAARRRIIGILVLAGSAACCQALAQTPEASRWYAQGLQALAEHRYADARAALQEAVTADPSFAGAWLDLAIATHADGDVVAAEEFLTILEARFELPEGIATGVRLLRQRIEAQASAPPAGWRWKSTFQGGAGYDTNANAGLALTDLTLTLPGGGITLPVAAEIQPRKDAYLLANLATEGMRKAGAGQLEVTGRLKARNNSTEREFDTLEAQAGLGFTSSQPAFGGGWAQALPGPWRVGLNLQQARLGGDTLLNSVSLSALHAWTKLACAPQASVELDYRRFPVARNLDSRLAWVGGLVSCPTAWAGDGGRFAVQLRLGYESANHPFTSNEGRPGGNTRHQEATFSHDWSWAGVNGTHRLEALAQWAGAQDTEGYSPLLANNARRDVRRVTYGLAYSVPLQPSSDGEGWRAVVTLQGYRQRSNLQVFRLDGEVLQFTLQRSW